MRDCSGKPAALRGYIPNLMLRIRYQEWVELRGMDVQVIVGRRARTCNGKPDPKPKGMVVGGGVGTPPNRINN